MNFVKKTNRSLSVHEVTGRFTGRRALHGEKGRSNGVRESRRREVPTPLDSRTSCTVRPVGVLALVPAALHTAHENIDSHGSTVHTRVTSARVVTLVYLGETTTAHGRSPRLRDVPAAKLSLSNAKVSQSSALIGVTRENHAV